LQFQCRVNFYLEISKIKKILIILINM